MVAEYIQALNDALGVGQEPMKLSLGAVVLRCLIVFTTGLVAVRFAMTRFNARNTTFDVLMGIVLGSVLSRAINGSAPFWPTLAASFLLVGLHAAIAHIASHWHPFGVLVKGKPDVLVRRGVVDRTRLRTHGLSEWDLEEALRLEGNVIGLEDVEEARMERNGRVSVVKRS